ncbi:hypothetical protein D1007_21328 [Hordeum vulgare]|nr:hypothetical protein D1007_21328 [Hordeum vulgare]
MAEARQARAERRATRVAQTAPEGPISARRSPSPGVNADMGPDAQEEQGSSHPATEHPNGCTATLSLIRASGAASHTRPEMPHGRHALSMTTELLHYRPSPHCHDKWLQHIEELVAAAGESAVLSFSFRPTVPRKRQGARCSTPTTPT